MHKVDLHTHSSASPDGGISASQYRQALAGGLLDFIAVTDHNRIDFALELKRELGESIIVGEEIMSSAGEIIGLYLREPVMPGLNPLETIDRIKAQGGIVYIPHPFETVRKGMHPSVLDKISDKVDIIEVCNGRAFLQNRSHQAVVWAKLNGVEGAASSDAHGKTGLGKTYTQIPEPPSAANLVSLLSRSVLKVGRPRLRSLLYPKYHKIRKRIHRTHG